MANEFRENFTARIAGVESIRQLMARQDASGLPTAFGRSEGSIYGDRSEFPSEVPRRADISDKTTHGWPISRAVISGAEPGESPLMTVFRQARTEIGGWGTRGFRAGTEPGATHGERAPTENFASMLTGPRRGFDEIQVAQGASLDEVPKTVPEPQPDDGNAIPNVGIKKADGSIALPKTEDEEAPHVSFWEYGDTSKPPTKPKAGQDVIEAVVCDGWLLVTALYDVTCDHVIGGFTFEGPKDPDVDGMAQLANFIWKVPRLDASMAECAAIRDKFNKGSPTSSREDDILDAWFGICACGRDAYNAQRNTMKGVDGAGNEVDIPKPPQIALDDITCAKPCLPSWRFWCGAAEFKEIARFGRIASSTLVDAAKGIYSHNFQLVARLKGKLLFVWKMTCLPLDTTEEGRSLIRQGAITPAGKPLGHYRPPWDKAPKARPVPDDCCCVIDSITIEKPQAFTRENAAWGHTFDIVIKYWYKILRHDEPDCQLQWWEWANEFPKWQRDSKDGNWNDQFKKINNSPVFDEWNSRSATRKDCHERKPDDLLVAVLTDTATLAWGETGPRHLLIYVKAWGCEGADIKCIHQYLDGSKGKREGWAAIVDCNLDSGTGQPKMPDQFIDLSDKAPPNAVPYQ